MCSLPNIFVVGVFVLLQSFCVSNGARLNPVEYIKTKQGDFAFPDELDMDMNDPSQQNYHSQYYHHHHHHPDFHHYHDGHDIEDNAERSSGNTPKSTNTNSTVEIPLEFIKDFNQYSVNDLLIKFVEGQENKGIIIEDRFGIGDERSAARRPNASVCMPELRTVQIATSDDPTVLYIPQCTRIERCGGCCSHSLLECQPQEIENLYFKVMKTQYTGGKKLKFLGEEIVMVEKHTKCACDCRIKSEDCKKFQEYRKTECRCACINSDEEKKCNKRSNIKLWNPDLCACQCRETMECSTGSFFDQNECKCMAALSKRRFNFQKRNHRSELLPIVPLPSDG